jgi:hypothetical protein
MGNKISRSPKVPRVFPDRVQEQSQPQTSKVASESLCKDASLSHGSNRWNKYAVPKKHAQVVQHTAGQRTAPEGPVLHVTGSLDSAGYDFAFGKKDKGTPIRARRNTSFISQPVTPKQRGVRWIDEEESSGNSTPVSEVFEFDRWSKVAATMPEVNVVVPRHLTHHSSVSSFSSTSSTTSLVATSSATTSLADAIMQSTPASDLSQSTSEQQHPQQHQVLPGAVPPCEPESQPVAVEAVVKETPPQTPANTVNENVKPVVPVAIPAASTLKPTLAHSSSFRRKKREPKGPRHRSFDEGVLSAMRTIPAVERFGTHVHDEQEWSPLEHVACYGRSVSAEGGIELCPTDASPCSSGPVSPFASSRRLHAPRDTPHIVFSNKVAGSLVFHSNSGDDDVHFC